MPDNSKQTNGNQNDKQLQPGQSQADMIKLLAASIEKLGAKIDSLQPVITPLPPGQQTTFQADFQVPLGPLETQKRGEYYDRDNTIQVAGPIDPVNPSSPVYNREEINVNIGHQNGEYVQVSNRGDDNLFVRVAHVGNEFADETVVLPGQAKIFNNVYELRLRSPTVGLPYTVTEELVCCPTNVSGNIVQVENVSGQALIVSISGATISFSGEIIVDVSGDVVHISGQSVITDSGSVTSVSGDIVTTGSGSATLTISGSITSVSGDIVEINSGLFVSISGQTVSITSGSFVSISGQDVFINSGSVTAVLNSIIVSSGNSTTTALGSGDIFSGTGISVLGYAQVTTELLTDASGTLLLQFSPDNVNWDHQYTDLIAPNEPISIHTPTCAEFFKLTYINGDLPQSFFRMQTMLKPIPSTGIVKDLEEPLLDEDDVLGTHSVITGKVTTGATSGQYIDVKVGPAGALFVSASGVIVYNSGQTVVIASGAFVQISGQIVGITSGSFVSISGQCIVTDSGSVTSVSGDIVTINSGLFVSISGQIVGITSGSFVSISGQIVGITSGSFVSISGQVVGITSGSFVSISGQIVGITSGSFVSISGQAVTVGSPSTVVNTSANPFAITGASGGVALSSGVVVSVTLKSLTTNSGDIYIGGSGTGTLPPFSGFGFILSQGETLSLDISNLNAIFACAAISGDRISYLGTR